MLWEITGYIMKTRYNQFYAHPGKELELQAFLEKIITYIKSSEGCSSCELWQQDDKPTEFLIVENWESSEHHKKSLENFPKESVSEIFPLLAKPPQAGFFNKL